MYVISKQQNKKILVVRLYQNAKTHVLCYSADLMSSPSPNPQGLASTKTQLVPRGLGLKLLTKSNKITCSTLLRKVSYPSKYSQCALQRCCWSGGLVSTGVPMHWSNAPV